MFDPKLVVFVLVAISVALFIAYRFSGPLLRCCLLPLAGALLGLSLGMVLVFHSLFFDPRHQTYFAFYREIQPGMTRDQVLTLLEHHYPQNGRRQRPRVAQDDPTGLSFFMHPEKHIEPNCEAIFLGMQSNRVTSKYYSAD